MDSLSRFWVGALVFFGLCLREGARVRPDNNKPVSRWLRRLYQFCVDRMGDNKREDKS